MYSNIQQYIVIYSSRPISITPPNTSLYNLEQSRTIQYCYDLYYDSKEGNKEKCVYRCLNCIVVGCQFLYIFKVPPVQLEYCIRAYECWTLPLTLVSFGSRGIRDKYCSSQRVDLRESRIHQQHRIVHIIVIYVFCTLLKHTNS